MAQVHIELPRLLEAVHAGPRDFTIEADDVASAFAELKEQLPRLSLHLFDETGSLRRHVLCFVNEQNCRWLADDQPLREGDTLLFTQAVTGG
ncbi:MAG: MoaD/ThiS family protein [Pirellulaceae bacterium]|jgi:molybdopterin converting factor small subunit|nr:MoaD/ThiS family protein [Pirellulaceae bacterium]